MNKKTIALNKKVLLMLCALALSFLLAGALLLPANEAAAYMRQDVLSTALTTVDEDGEKALDAAWDGSTLGDTEIEYANGVSDNYLYLYGEPMLMQFATDITKHEDLVLEFDYMAESNANAYMGYMQFGPFAGRDPAQPSEGTVPMFNYLSQQQIGNGTFQVQDLRDTASSDEVQTVSNFAYGFVPGNRIRLTFEVESGDCYVAQRPIGSDAEFADDIRIVEFMKGPTDHLISEEAPVHFLWITYRQIMLGDVVLRYESGEIIHDVNFDTDLRTYWGNFLNGHHMINVDRPTYQCVSPIISGMSTGERLVLKEPVTETPAWEGTANPVFQIESTVRLIDMAENQSFGFLFGLQEGAEAWDSENVVYLKFYKGTDSLGYMDVLRGGEPVYEHPVPVAYNLFNNYAIKVVGYANGRLEIYLNGVIAGGYEAGDMYGKMAIVSEGEGTSRFGFGADFKVTAVADAVYDGADQAINFNALAGSSEAAYIDEDAWYLNSANAAYFVDAEEAKGLHVDEDGALFFEGTTDGAMFAPKGEYGNFILEFDFYNFADADKPEQDTESYEYGYSPLGVSFGKTAYDANWASAKIFMIYGDHIAFQALNDNPVTTDSANIATAGKWISFKIVAVNNTVSVYTAELAGAGNYEGASYTLLKEFTCQNAAGYISFASTEGGYFKLDNIRITNIDESGTEGYVDFAPVEDDFGPASVAAASSNDAYGTVTGGGACSLGDTVTVTASAKEHYQFVEWQNAEGTKVSEDAEYSFRVLEREVSLKAVFEPIPYTITVSSNDDAMGTVSGGTSAAYDAEVTVTAVPNKYHEFVEWQNAEGTKVSDSASYTFKVAGNTALKAVFAKATYTVTANTNNAEYGTVSGGGQVEGGQSVTLTATPKTGYVFIRWEDDSQQQLSTEATYEFIPEGDITVTAVFGEKSFTITAESSNDEHGTVTGGGAYQEGEQATLTATAKTGYKFVRWEDAAGKSVSTEATYTFTVSADAEFTAVFEADSAVTDPDDDKDPDDGNQPGGEDPDGQDDTETGCGGVAMGTSLALGAVCALAAVVLLRKRA